MSNTPSDSDIESIVKLELNEYLNGAYQDHNGTKDQLMCFARAIEAEVRKQDDALIRQMLGALWINCSEQTDSIASRAITAARKRLERNQHDTRTT